MDSTSEFEAEDAVQRRHLAGEIARIRSATYHQRPVGGLAGAGRDPLPCGPMADPSPLEDLLEQLRARGVRVTTARRAVLADLVRRGSTHPTADQVARRVRRSNPEVHLSTVYRTLELLEELGLVNRVTVGPGSTGYHLAGDRHHHAVCESCGTVIDLADAELAPLVRQLARRHGFDARPRHVTITGRCADCR